MPTVGPLTARRRSAAINPRRGSLNQLSTLWRQRGASFASELRGPQARGASEAVRTADQPSLLNQYPAHGAEGISEVVGPDPVEHERGWLVALAAEEDDGAVEVAARGAAGDEESQWTRRSSRASSRLARDLPSRRGRSDAAFLDVRGLAAP